MYNKTVNNQGYIQVFLVVFLLTALTLFVGAILTQNFSLLSNAATSDPACVRGKVVVKISPPTTTGLAGTTRNYSILITNNDTPQCGASIFRIAYNWAKGITPVTTTDELLVDAGRQSAGVVTIKSDPGLVKGNYSNIVNVNTGDNIANHVASTSLIYIVGSATQPTPRSTPINNPPVILTVLLPTAYLNTDYTALIRTQDPDRQKVSLSVTGLPAGINMKGCLTNPNAMPITTCTVAGKPTAKPGSYTVTVVATDPTGLKATKQLILKVVRPSIFGKFLNNGSLSGAPSRQ